MSLQYALSSPSSDVRSKSNYESSEFMGVRYFFELFLFRLKCLLAIYSDLRGSLSSNSDKKTIMCKLPKTAMDILMIFPAIFIGCNSP